ncbi:M23 family metallopeptidase [Ottowia sp.]|uniref:M23 family metallopeptidase n=1 Tax=Ottowia sp. TaxID=1898956 RepID=UPI003A8C3B10
MTRSTVLIITPEQTRSVEVSTAWLRWLKPTLTGLTLSTLGLTAGLAALAFHWHTERTQHTQQVSALQQQLSDLGNTTSQELNAKLEEVNTRLAALRQSEKTVADVVQYLQSRGVDVKPVSVEPRNGQPNPAAGGVPPKSAKPAAHLSGRFASDTKTLLQTLQATPLGAPHPGPLSSDFGQRANPFTGRGSETHAGLDFKGDTGETVTVTAQGRVISAKRQGGYGNLVQVQHANGYATAYAHLSRILVKPGQRLKAGDAVGTLGSTGRSTGPHLHYEVTRHGERLDPATFLNLTPAEAPKH